MNEDLDAAAGSGAQHVVGQGLGKVGREQTGPLEQALVLVGGMAVYAHHYGHFGRVGRQTRAHLRDGGFDQIAVGAHAVEHAVRHRKIEVVLHGDGELGEIERVGRQVVRQRQLGRQIILGDTQMMRDQSPDARFNDAPHSHLLPAVPLGRIGCDEGLARECTEGIDAPRQWRSDWTARDRSARFRCALVAQWIEHLPPKQGVAGSIPAGGIPIPQRNLHQHHDPLLTR